MHCNKLSNRLKKFLSLTSHSLLRLTARLRDKDCKHGDFHGGGAVDKKPPANAGDKGLIPGPGGSHMLQSN